MRVLLAPDRFDGTLTAAEAARAMAEGWRRRAPDDEVDLAPVADGGPGFLDVLHHALGGSLLGVTTRDPFGAPVPGAVLVVEEEGGPAAYVEAAQACGHAVADPARVLTASSAGVGDLVGHAVAAGARRVVVGLGGSAVLDGGAGLLAALGATADAPLEAGPLALADVRDVDLTAPRRLLEGVTVTVAVDVACTLTGLFGAAKTFGPDLGLGDDGVLAVDHALEAWAHATDRRLSLREGTGAAGGVGFGPLLLGAGYRPGAELVLDAVGLAERCRRADLVVTGEGRFDFASRAGTVPHGVALLAAAAVRPCVVVAGEVLVGTREMRALGVEAAYSVVDEVGRTEAVEAAYDALVRTTERVARTWSR
ncbi:MAG: glycerate kinase [Nocardioides alkalitolerans]